MSDIEPSTTTVREGLKQARRRLTPAEQIQAARAALVRAQRRQHAHDTRSKIVLGGAVLAWVRKDVRAAQALLRYLDATPSRPQDVDALTRVRDELSHIVGAAGNASH